LFERAADGRHAPLSDGTTPGEWVHPEVAEVMSELGIDLTGRKPQLPTRKFAQKGDMVIAMAAAINAHSFQTSATSTGICPTQGTGRSTTSAPHAMRSAAAS
jgi:protein-tyrosine-phosphatase